MGIMLGVMSDLHGPILINWEQTVNSKALAAAGRLLYLFVHQPVLEMQI